MVDGTTVLDVVRAARPGASVEYAEFILWERTAFPGAFSAKALYKAASGYVRAIASGRRLCELCHREAVHNGLCDCCRRALR